MSNLDRLSAEAQSQRNQELPPWERPRREWRKSSPGYDLLRGHVPDKLIYRLLIRHQARHFWNRSNPPGRKWFTVDKHRGFTGRMLAHFALANGWSEAQAKLLLQAWRHRHDLPLHTVQLQEMLAAAMKATEGLRRAFDEQKEGKMKDKTSWRVQQWLTTHGPSSSAEVAEGLDISKEAARQDLCRLTKAGKVHKLGYGRHSSVTESVTSGVTELDKQNKNKKETFSITNTVTVVSRLPDPTVGEEERYLRQIKWNERPDGTFQVDPPDEGLTREQEGEFEQDFDRWQRDLAAFTRSRPEALRPRPTKPLYRWL